MPAVLIRQDGSEVDLVLDGVIRYREMPETQISQHPAQNRTVFTDNQTRLQMPIAITWIVSETPMISGITRGQERLDEVRAWLDGAIGRFLIYYDPDMAGQLRPNLLLQSWPMERAGTYGVTYEITLVETQVADVRTVELGPERTPRTGQTARADVAAGRAPEQDRGEQPTKRKSVFAATLDLIPGGD